jgi:serine protease Do
MHTQANGSGRQQRRLALWLGWLAVLGLAGSMWSAAAQDLPPEVLQAQTKRIQAIERVKPAVVAVFDRGRKGGGSGVLIDERGYALTNYHVVEPTGPFMQCGLPDGVLYDAVLVGIDKVGDVALIKLLPKQPGQKFPTAPLGR